jgi:hypothetical protein
MIMVMRYAWFRLGYTMVMVTVAIAVIPATVIIIQVAIEAGRAGYAFMRGA